MNPNDDLRKQELGRKATPFVVVLVLVVLSAIIYVPAFDAPFLFDSRSSIEENERVHQLVPAAWFHGNRWLALFTFALNYEINNGELWSFHLTNVLIHGIAACILFGIVVRTLSKIEHQPWLQTHCRSIGVYSTLIWFAHPLQTQSVIYTVQRMESLMGMFLLLCLYCFIRSRDSERTYFWMFLSIASCYFSAFSKEVAVAIPAVVFAYDYVFESASNSEDAETGRLPAAIRERWMYYVCLSGVLLLFASPLTTFFESVGSSKDSAVATVEPSSTTEPNAKNSQNSEDRFSAAISIKGLSPISYATNQPSVILYYLSKSFFPVNLCLDRAWPIRTAQEQVIPIVVVSGLLLSGFVLIVRRSPVGFCIASFFLVLAPTSSFLPILDLCYEHRMYISLAAVIVPFTCTVVWIGSLFGSRSTVIVNVLMVAVVITLSLASYSRCQVYRSRLDMWADVIAKAPHNPRGYLNHGEVSYFEEDDMEAAIQDYNNCLEQMLNPKFKIPPVISIRTVYKNLSIVHNNLGLKMLKGKRFSNALFHFEQAIANNSSNASAFSNMGYYHLVRKSFAEAAKWANQALEIDPDLESAKEIVRRANEASRVSQ